MRSAMGLRIGNFYDANDRSMFAICFKESSMSRDVFVAGVGMIPFAKPGKSDPYFQMGSTATGLALADAGVSYDAVQQAYVGYVYADSTAGQRALYEVGMSGIPIVNVNNNCSTGSTALFLARQAVASGAADCVLALGFEQMTPGALGSVFNDRPTPFDRFEEETDALVGDNGVPLALRYFGGAGKAHMEQYGTQLSTFAKIRAKASRHAARNPLALFRTEVTAEEVMASPVMWGKLVEFLYNPPMPPQASTTAPAPMARGSPSGPAAMTPPQAEASAKKSSRVVCSRSSMFSQRRTSFSRVWVISWPVISSWNRMRGRECAPSRVKRRAPWSSRAKRTPRRTRSRMIELEERIIRSTVAGLFS